MTSHIRRPHMASDGLAEPESVAFIKSFDRKIQLRPSAYLDALNTLGRAATDTSIDLSNLGEEREATQLTTRDFTPEKMIVSFFSKRHDLDTVFDRDTSGALSEDPVHTTLLGKHKHMMSVQRRPGKDVSTNGQRADREAIEARDELRRHQLAFYITRIIDWRSNTGASKDLSSTG